ncbi:MAG: indolepyruvate ferredoxin oxidoreductase subunit alpha [Candidatus Omnitrophica bacterium]|nr:indolepyruvate ferredoxin oxidoreductase subunit alpha [Candidatus Omnitrophota bacterium]
MAKKPTQLLSGNEAVALGAAEAGLGFASGYPGTPSTEIIESLARLTDIDCQWAINEKVAFEVAYGASIGGLRSLFTAKHVGINVAMDPLMTAAYTGVNGGFVVVSCDDPGMGSSQNEQDNRLLAQAAKIPLVEPVSPGEAHTFVKEAFQISEDFDTPVMLRMTTRVCHTKQNITPGIAQPMVRKPFATDIRKYVMLPANARARRTGMDQRLAHLKDYSEHGPLNTVELNNRKLGFIVSGVAYLHAKEMYPNASFLKLGMSYPFPADMARSFAQSVEKVVVLEELEPFIETMCRLAGITVQGKHPSFAMGELKPEFVPLIVDGKEKTTVLAAARKPALCAGCPHRLVFGVLRTLGLTVAGDIGCYTLSAIAPFESMHTCLCMGGGITIFEGLWHALKKNVVGVIGDSTFMHSGVTGLMSAAYNGAKGVIIILDNGTTAMTGGQPHPATGTGLRGQKTKQVKIEDLARVAGADEVDVIDPINVKEFEALLKQRVSEDKLSVIITRRPCKLSC